MRAEITPGGRIGTYTLKLDGVDVSRDVVGIDLEMMSGHVAQLRVALLVEVGVADTDVEILLHESTIQVLHKMGWRKHCARCGEEHPAELLCSDAARQVRS